MKIVKGNLFDHLSQDQNILIAHLANTMGGFGKGFVVPLKQFFPIVHTEYMACIKRNNFEVGDTHFVRVNQSLAVANMLVQTSFYKHINFSYDNLFAAMWHVADYAKLYDKTIYCPKFGSGLAGGDWSIIQSEIEKIWTEHNIPVYVFEI